MLTTSASLRRWVGLVYETSDVTLSIVMRQEIVGCAGGDDGGKGGVTGGCVAFEGVGGGVGGVGGEIGGNAGAGASGANDALIVYCAVGPACTSVFEASSSMV